ncbi:LysR family transcriptional regulator [Neomegalonema perideroedes]|uniref:LysR family transcriptional regulator n=1 Tax=Neomegalonema perideroedes TaxID=217219 RepID=UPI00035E03DF|nr:LysR family transcriptional regulator [Neomegalonema perideroedes]
MLIRHLKFFIVLAEEKHFGRAAEACGVTQPTLSQAIRKLEEDLNLALVIRGHRFTALTPEGEKLLRWGRRILADHDSLHEDLRGAQGGLTGDLRLGVIPAAMPMVSLISERFARRHPLAGIEIRSMSFQALRRALEIFEIDGGVTYLDEASQEGLQGFPLYRERYLFACRAGHPLAAREIVDWAEAAAQPLCLLREEMKHRRILDEAAADFGVSLRPKITCNSFLGVASHLRAGPWCAIVPQAFRFVFGEVGGLALLEMPEAPRRHMVGLVLAERAPQTPMAAALQACVEEADFESRLETLPPQKAAE